MKFDFNRYEQGKYIKNCAFEPCGKEFEGPLNRKYCCDTCKERQKAWNSKLIALAANGDDLKIRKALRILKKNFKPGKDGGFRVHKMELYNNGFPFDLPTNKVKFDWFDGEMKTIGLFSFYTKGEYFFFYNNLKM
jgi:hypothetical protein